DVDVTHAAVEVAALTALQPKRRVVLGVYFDRAGEHVDEFLAAVLAPVIDLVHLAGPHPDLERHHRLAGNLGSMRAIVVLAAGEVVALIALGRGLTAGH